VRPIHRTSRLTIMEVKLNRGVVIQYTTTTESKSEEDAPVYLLVDGVQGNSPKLRCIYSPEIVFDTTDKLFRYRDRCIAIDDVFKDFDDTFSRELLFRRLDIYKNDIPKR